MIFLIPVFLWLPLGLLLVRYNCPYQFAHLCDLVSDCQISLPNILLSSYMIEFPFLSLIVVRFYYFLVGSHLWCCRIIFVIIEVIIHDLSKFRPRFSVVRLTVSLNRLFFFPFPHILPALLRRSDFLLLHNLSRVTFPAVIQFCIIVCLSKYSTTLPCHCFITFWFIVNRISIFSFVHWIFQSLMIGFLLWVYVLCSLSFSSSLIIFHFINNLATNLVL